MPDSASSIGGLLLTQSWRVVAGAAIDEVATRVGETQKLEGEAKGEAPSLQRRGAEKQRFISPIDLPVFWHTSMSGDMALSVLPVPGVFGGECVLLSEALQRILVGVFSSVLADFTRVGVKQAPSPLAPLSTTFVILQSRSSRSISRSPTGRSSWTTAG